MWARRAACALVGVVGVACLAPPPPIVVDTPYGVVRAASRGKADEVAELLTRLAPAVKTVLPGAQDREIDVWVQERLAVYRFHQRPDSVRGFTLLDAEFDAKRIHLQESGQSPWYLAHELVHALIGPSWSPLPGILEEGLGDVIAERLNPEYEEHIRAHRLLNASAFTGGVELEVVYREPGVGPWRQWPERTVSGILQVGGAVDPATLGELLRTPRSDLHRRWADIPESFYGISWLIVSRMVERIGLDGLYDLCQRARDSGLELVPVAWIEEAAELDLEQLDPAFLASCFDRRALSTALFLQPEAFAEVAVDALAPLHGALAFGDVYRRVRPAFRLGHASPVQVGMNSGPVYRSMRQAWQTLPQPLAGTTTAP
ncbi:MAG TPA: hypothetical protein VF530_01730 [Planctomycetota bacterium]